MQKTISTWIAFAVVLILIPARTSFGWIDTGHKIVALVAWEDLTPKTRAAVTELLKKHARYDKDLLLNLPDGYTPEQTDRYAFATAATWPDMVRSRNNPMSTLYSHPSWHYVDMPVVEDGVQVPPATDAPGTDAPASGPKDVLEALTFSTGQLKDNTTVPPEKAVAICWIAHLVGDIHQPLHAVSRYDKKQPNGDHGGNYDFVLRDPPYSDSRMKLHLLWDSLPGDYKSFQLVSYQAMGLHNDPQYSRDKLREQIAVKDFTAWAKESYKLAVDVVYKTDMLEEATGKPPTRDETIPGVPPGYLANAELVASKQVVLAGYRLADVLNSIFDPKP